jgi:hypothetical protein
VKDFFFESSWLIGFELFSGTFDSFKLLPRMAYLRYTELHVMDTS